MCYDDRATQGRGMKTDCCVYEVLVDGVVRYIGMGSAKRGSIHVSIARRVKRKSASGLRDLSALNVHLRLAKAISQNAVIEHRIILNDLTRADAKEHEKRAIAAAPKGQLWNRHSGGGGAVPDRMKELWADPKWRKKQSALLRAVWKNPAHRKTMLALRSDPEVRRRISDFVTKRFSRQSEREEQSRRLTQFYAKNPQRRTKHSKLVKKLWVNNYDRFKIAVTAHWSDPAQRKRQSEAAKRQWASPDGRAKLTKAAKGVWTPELRRWRSEKTKAQLSDPAERSRMRAATQRRWNDPERRAKMTQAIREGHARAKIKRRLAQQRP